MIRYGAVGLACIMLAACSGWPSVTSSALQPIQTSGPALVVGVPSDGTAVPIAVIDNLPPAVSATSVREDPRGCFAVLALDDTLSPVTGPDGAQLCRS